MNAILSVLKSALQHNLEGTVLMAASQYVFMFFHKALNIALHSCNTLGFTADEDPQFNHFFLLKINDLYY